MYPGLNVAHPQSYQFLGCNGEKVFIALCGIATRGRTAGFAMALADRKAGFGAIRYFVSSA
jgi:hypothetical protein